MVKKLTFSKVRQKLGLSKVRPPVFVKVSGDLFYRPDVIEWIRKLAAEYYVVILVGGGTQINEAFEEAGFEVGEHGPLGRETKNLEEKQLARDILEVNKDVLQDLLALRGISAYVEKPVWEVAGVLCHINADIFTLAVYHGFDKLFVLTLESRVQAKKLELERYPKIEVVGFPEEFDGE